jgi:hypothetical protein
MSLVASANEHIDEIAEGLFRVFGNHAGKIIPETDPDTGDEIHWLHLSAVMPGKIQVRVFNVATELRAALDHAVYVAAVTLGTRPDPTKTAFAFADSAAELDGEIERRCGHVPADIKAVLRRLKPYPGGDEALWRLNKLRNVKDHRRLLVPDCTVDGMHLTGQVHVSPEYAGPEPPVVQWRPKLPPRDNQVPIVRLARGMSAKYDLNTAIHVVFGEPADLAEFGVIEFLVEARRAVWNAVTLIAEETARILKTRTV